MTVVAFMIVCRKTEEVNQVVKIEVQVRRTVATQSMVTYKRKYLNPRFMPLCDELQGAFTSGTSERP